MAGLAVTQKFMLGAATVMLGPMANLFDMMPDTHGIGLVKNFQMTSEPSTVDLTQGVRNNVVMTVVNGSNVRASMEVYEYTSKNLAYGLGLDGSTFSSQTVSTTLTAAIDGNPTPTSTVAVTSVTGLAIGDYIMIIDSTSDDRIITRKISNIASLNITTSVAIGVDIPNGSVVKKVNVLHAGPADDTLFLASKVVGLFADGTKCELLFPKVRVVRGFTLGFSTDSFGSMPFEFRTLNLVSTDTFYTEFGSGADFAEIRTAA